MKKVLALVMALVLVLSLAACGKPTLESLKDGIYYRDYSDNEVHYIFKDGIVYIRHNTTVDYPDSPSGKLNVDGKETEVAKYKDLTDSTITIIDGSQAKKYEYTMDKDNYEAVFSSAFLDSGKSKFIFRY